MKKLKKLMAVLLAVMLVLAVQVPVDVYKRQVLSSVPSRLCSLAEE